MNQTTKELKRLLSSATDRYQKLQDKDGKRGIALQANINAYTQELKRRDEQ